MVEKKELQHGSLVRFFTLNKHFNRRAISDGWHSGTVEHIGRAYATVGFTRGGTHVRLDVPFGDLQLWKDVGVKKFKSNEETVMTEGTQDTTSATTSAATHAAKKTAKKASKKAATKKPASKSNGVSAHDELYNTMVVATKKAEEKREGTFFHIMAGLAKKPVKLQTLIDKMVSTPGHTNKTENKKRDVVQVRVRDAYSYLGLLKKA
jgi:hypothetical protein